MGARRYLDLYANHSGVIDEKKLEASVDMERMRVAHHVGRAAKPIIECVRAGQAALIVRFTSRRRKHQIGASSSFPHSVLGD